MANDGTVKIGTELDKSGLSKGLSDLGNFAKKGTAVAGGIAAAGVAAAGAVTKAALDSVASLEQNIGGVETLFKENADIVIENANRAYKTAGVSANEYMSSVTSFAASLLQSLSGDTEAAAKTADMAMTDMSDNANKMGTSMEAIQNAYQGFAKQNYTMLDNLKLGYGGTKTEMERLLKDAQELSGVEYNIDNLSDVYSAIHVIQEELGITGTTAKEASTTIEGSISSAQDAWDNFLAGSGTAEELVGSLITAGEVVLKNLGEIIPRLAETIPAAAGMIGSHIVEQLPSFAAFGLQAIERITSGITSGAPSLILKAQSLIVNFSKEISSRLPQILSTGVEIISSLVDGLLSAAPQVIQQASQMLTTYVSTMLSNIPVIMNAGTQLLLNLLNSLVSNAPKIIQQAAQMIIQYVATILQNLPQILQAGIQLIGKLLAGIIQAVPKIIAAIPSMVANIGKTFLSYDWLSIGKNIISGIASGVSNAAGNLVNAAVNAASNAINTVKGWLGIHSPSRKAKKEIGIPLIAGAAEGAEEAAPEFEKAAVGSAEDAVEAMKRASAADFVARMQAKSYKMAENNEMAARNKYKNNGYDPDNPDDEGSMTIHNQFNVDGKPLVDETVKKTKKEIAKEQRSNQAVKGDVVFA